MKIAFDTNEYRFTHGAEPRGRGGWAFEFPGSNEPWFVPGPGRTFGEAKKAAAEEALRRFPTATHLIVTVCT